MTKIGTKEKELKYVLKPVYSGTVAEKEIIDFNELTHYHLVEMIKTSPPLANPFYVYKEFSESNPELLVQNKNIKY